jgi:hypothetical protein
MILNNEEAIMALAITTTATYSKNIGKTKGDRTPCVICGKGIKQPRYYVHVHHGGTHVVTEAEAAQLNDAGRDGFDLDFLPIGPDCLRAHPEYRPYVTIAEVG